MEEIFSRFENISGVTVQYYVTCKREAWLFAHKIHPDQDDENILMGRALAQIKEEDLPGIFSHLRIDRIGKAKGHFQITEYKKTLKNMEGARAQLLFYIYILTKSLRLKRVDGKIISGKRVIFVEGNEENLNKMERLLEELDAFLRLPKPPPPEPIRFCRQCGYRNYCY